ncbi:hypothetical protein NDU88_003005 [Pleurodeles waltl]|uniref:Uncharacterized protein n=1 Tax=Pleurodeles waltl TaxID=8319 RepID=A0AAV7NHZ9_PLEWA|nr:hypothetical protein NDU88_003005 [Pleurodeles waltl]
MPLRELRGGAHLCTQSKGQVPLSPFLFRRDKAVPGPSARAAKVQGSPMVCPIQHSGPAATDRHRRASADWSSPRSIVGRSDPLPAPVRPLHPGLGPVPVMGGSSLLVSTESGWGGGQKILWHPLCPLSGSCGSRISAPRGSGPLFDVYLGPQRVGLHVAGGPGRPASPLLSSAVAGTAQASRGPRPGEAASPQRGPPPGPLSPSGSAGPGVSLARPRTSGERQSAAQLLNYTRVVQSPGTRLRWPRHTPPGTPSPGAYAAAQDAGRLPCRTPLGPRGGADSRRRAGTPELRFSIHRRQGPLGYSLRPSEQEHRIRVWGGFLEAAAEMAAPTSSADNGWSNNWCPNGTAERGALRAESKGQVQPPVWWLPYTGDCNNL